MKLFLILSILSLASANVCNCKDTCIQKDDLGRSTWFLLHHMAKANEATDENNFAFAVFMHTLAELYPCAECREHVQSNLQQVEMPVLDPMWMCNFHNIVNKQLKKPIYNCSNIDR